MNICDFARPYSMWHGVQQYLAEHPGGTCLDGYAAAGWGNPPGSHWVDIPDVIWTDNYDLTRCYEKGRYGAGSSNVMEISRACTVTGSFTGTGSLHNHAGSYGNTIVGAFSNANRPHTTLFPVDWSSTTTADTPSPYDPA